jgi:hypothetical protein
MLSADDARSVWLREKEALLCFDISKRAKTTDIKKDMNLIQFSSIIVPLLSGSRF